MQMMMMDGGTTTSDNEHAPLEDDDAHDDDDHSMDLSIGGENNFGGGMKSFDNALLEQAIQQENKEQYQAQLDQDANMDIFSDSAGRAEDLLLFGTPEASLTDIMQVGLGMSGTDLYANGDPLDASDPFFHGMETAGNNNSNDSSFGVSFLRTPMLSSAPQLMQQQPSSSTDRPKSIRFAEEISTLFGVDSVGNTITNQGLISDTANDLDSSIQTLDIFDEGRPPSASSSAGSLESSFNDEDDDDSYMSAVDEDEEEKKIRQAMMYAVGGAGMMALAGWAGKQVLKFFDKVRTILYVCVLDVIRILLLGYRHVMSHIMVDSFLNFIDGQR
jgi:hypothetical protein